MGLKRGEFGPILLPMKLMSIVMIETWKVYKIVSISSREYVLAFIFYSFSLCIFFSYFIFPGLGWNLELEIIMSKKIKNKNVLIFYKLRTTIFDISVY